MPQRREIVERQVLVRLHVEVFGQLAEELSLLDAVDAQVGFQVGIQLDDFGRIAGLLDHEVDQELFQFSRGRAAVLDAAARPVCGNGCCDRAGASAKAGCTGAVAGGIAAATGCAGSRPDRLGRRGARKFSTCRSVGKSSSDRFCGRLHVEVFGQLAEQLGLLDAVDAQVGFQVGVELDDFGRIAGLLDHEVDQELFQLGRIAGWCRRRRRSLPGRRRVAMRRLSCAVGHERRNARQPGILLAADGAAGLNCAAAICHETESRASAIATAPAWSAVPDSPPELPDVG